MIEIESVATRLESLVQHMAEQSAGQAAEVAMNNPVLKTVRGHLNTAGAIPTSEGEEDPWIKKMMEKRGKLARKTIEFQKAIEQAQNAYKEQAGQEGAPESDAQSMLAADSEDLQAIMWTYAAVSSLGNPALKGEATTGQRVG